MSRDAPYNKVTLQVKGPLTLMLDLKVMGLASGQPLSTVVQPLSGFTPTGDLAIIYSGTWQCALPYILKKDGAALPSKSFSVQSTRLTLLRQSIDGTHTYVISPTTLNNVFLPLILR